VFVGPGDAADPACTVCAQVAPVGALGFETSSPEDESFATLSLGVDMEELQSRFRDQSRRFLAVAAMMVLALAAGMALIYRGVHRELVQARRTENFVAAVTHELRTPLSAIRLHGEMLLDGWASDPERQREYYRRIVRETERLSMLVERVLEKSRLKEGGEATTTGDLNALVLDLRHDLRRPEGGPDDLAVELAPDLGPVRLSPEAVAGILSNLVENARKYAPSSGAGEPILIRTRRDRRGVVLEVADRGPGIPPEERERIFEAFYRIGNESTRTTRGTGLGLHLVRLHAESVGARVGVRAREGGGSVFETVFRPAA
jgi:signal transduction histidine kinase